VWCRLVSTVNEREAISMARGLQAENATLLIRLGALAILLPRSERSDKEDHGDAEEKEVASWVSASSQFGEEGEHGSLNSSLSWPSKSLLCKLR
jgi:hypothetical protein